MSIETWRERYAHLLEEIALEHNYSDEAQPEDYEKLAAEVFDNDELGGKHGAKAFFSRPQIRKNEAPKTVSRTLPGWFFNDAAIREILSIQFPKMHEGHTGTASCNCPGCRDLRGAALWNFIILGLRNNRPAEEIARDWSSEPEPKKKKTPIKPDANNKKCENCRENVPGRGPVPCPSCAKKWENILKSHGLAENNGQNDYQDHEYPGHKPIDAAYVRRVIQQIKFVASGLRTDGKARKATKGVENTVLNSEYVRVEP